MKIRLEIDEVNGKAFNIELNNSNYDELRQYLLTIKEFEKAGILP